MKSVTFTVTANVQDGKTQAVVGVPVISPVSLLIENTVENIGGVPVILQEYGLLPPVAVIVNEYGLATTPGVMFVVWMLGGDCANTSGAKWMAKVNKPNNAAATFNREIIVAEPVATGELF